jgi:hypothetical protein
VNFFELLSNQVSGSISGAIIDNDSLEMSELLFPHAVKKTFGK